MEAPKAVRHITFRCPPCPKQCRTLPMFAASVDLFLPQSQESIHQCCHDPILWTGGRRHQPIGIKHQLHRFTRDHDGGVHSIHRVADRVFAAAGVEAGVKKGGCWHDVWTTCQLRKTAAIRSPESYNQVQGTLRLSPPYTQ